MTQTEIKARVSFAQAVTAAQAEERFQRIMRDALGLDDKPVTIDNEIARQLYRVRQTKRRVSRIRGLAAIDSQCETTSHDIARVETPQEHVAKFYELFAIGTVAETRLW